MMLNLLLLIGLGLVAAQEFDSSGCSDDVEYLCNNFKACADAGKVEADAWEILCSIVDPTAATDSLRVDTASYVTPVRADTTQTTRNRIQTEPTTLPATESNGSGDGDVVTGSGDVILDDEEDADLPVIKQPLKNMTRKAGTSPSMSCGASNTISLGITKLSDAPSHNPDEESDAATTTSQFSNTLNNIQVYPHEGWYRCRACNRNGCAESDGYLRIGSLCDGVTCPRTQIPQENEDEDTCECVCNSKCDFTFKPVCSNYCDSEPNECIMFFNGCQKERYDVDTLLNGQCPQIVPATAELSSSSVGAGTTFTCSTSGTPVPTITWYQDGVVLEGETGDILSVDEDEEGTFHCQARNCKVNIATSNEITIIPELEVEGSVSTCQITGRNNIITYDQVSYGIVGACDYVAAMDCSRYEWFVYTRSRECGDNNEGSCVATVTAIVGRDMVEMMRGWLVNYGGKKVQPKDFVNEVITLENGFELFFDGGWLKLTKAVGDGSTNLTVYWDGYTSVMIQSPQDTNTCGLCGNNDGKSDNDFTPRGGNGNVPPADFADSWKLDRRNRCSVTQDVPPVDDTCSTPDLFNAATSKCKELLASDSLSGCLNRDTFLDTCIRDDCLGQVTRDLQPSCIVAKAYAKQCYTTQYPLKSPIPRVVNSAKDWNDEGKCPNDEENRPIILAQGCPQD